MWPVLCMLLLFTASLFADDEDERQKKTFQTDNPFEVSDSFAFLPFALISGGYDNNIFQSPLILNTVSNNTQSAPYLDLELGTEARLKLNDSQYIALVYSYSHTEYPGFPVNRVQVHDISADFYRKVSADFKWKLETDVKRKYKIGTDINGAPLNQKYSYWSFDAGPTFYFYLRSKKENALVKKTRINLALQEKYYNYDEPALPYISLDSLEENIKLGITPYIGDHFQVNIDISQRFKHYLNALAQDTNGNDVPGITRQKYYTEISITPEWEITKGLSWLLGYSYKMRLDPYQSYYSYTSHIVDTGIKWELASRTIIELDAQYEWRTYEVKQSPLINAGLAYQYFDVSADVEQPLKDWVSLFVHADWSDKDSNGDIETSSIYRAYRELKAFGGLKIDF